MVLILENVIVTKNGIKINVYLNVKKLWKQGVCNKNSICNPIVWTCEYDEYLNNCT